jgi:hypothetical protein
MVSNTPESTPEKPWAILGITRKQYAAARPWKKAGMTKEKYAERLDLRLYEWSPMNALKSLSRKEAML